MSTEIEDLQSRLAFQEDTLSELNAIVARQDRQIEALTDALTRLAKKLDDMAYDAQQSTATAASEVPPHY
ncbi:SlyX family protein [Gilvimarinus sp. DA14]|uniref:SlyX family protein n=1 Tax=Gilvimarinus sp. DA14 TaxID=2956798 RepID=UPI0020B6BA34|nr:SlyX family protein [Gilvimarinus sp. DA14]UTF60898.1 SlyX family protein [Gilvimarinus sp. DA14]